MRERSAHDGARAGAPGSGEACAAVLMDACPEDRVEGLADELEALADLRRRSEGFDETLSAGAMAGPSGQEAIRKALGRQLSTPARALLMELAERGLPALLPDVAAQFRRLAQLGRGMVPVEVVSAVPLDEAARRDLAARLEATVGKPIVMTARTDASLLGGLRVRIGDRLFDTSVAGAMTRLRDALRAEPLVRVP